MSESDFPRAPLNEKIMARKMQRIAVVGSGIAGLSVAWLLSQHFEVTLYEAETRLGGHSNTVDVTIDGIKVAADTGFLVCNDRTYHNLLSLFRHLKVELVASEMSFSVQIEREKLAWAGASLATLFGDKKNLLRPKFWRMVRDVLRFNRAAPVFLEAQNASLTVGEYLQQHGYSEVFAQWYLLPMAAAIWSCPTATVLDFPALTLIRFFKQHGLLQVSNRPQWMTVKNGSRTYVEKLRAGITRIQAGDLVQQIIRDATGVTLLSKSGAAQFDQVVLACHSDQALAMLSEPSAAEIAVLSAIQYQPNRAVLHTDASLLPKRKSLWSAWNFHTLSTDKSSQAVAVSYLLNKLQPLPIKTPLLVTLNPVAEIPAAQVLADIAYAHPLLDSAAIAAQAKLPALQGINRTWFCGAWTGYGFHEDGLKSALHVAAALGVSPPWHTPKQ
ncbi:MAG: FAD-dependent oxidoreductase [Sideroxydans sp.]|nr:FAD-dependent oxidoreductase [Sideroxydans sp.]